MVARLTTRFAVALVASLGLAGLFVDASGWAATPAAPQETEAALVAARPWHSRPRDHARHARRHQPEQLHGRVQLHAAARRPR